MIVTPSAEVAGHRVVHNIGLVYGNTIGSPMSPLPPRAWFRLSDLLGRLRPL